MATITGGLKLASVAATIKYTTAKPNVSGGFMILLAIRHQHWG